MTTGIRSTRAAALFGVTSPLHNELLACVLAVNADLRTVGIVTESTMTIVRNLTDRHNAIKAKKNG